MLWLLPVDGFSVTAICTAGFPSVGKSSLLTILTGTESEAAAYEFTTLTCIPGVIHYNDAKIQLLDLPGIIEGAAEGKGRGRQVIASSSSSSNSDSRRRGDSCKATVSLGKPAHLQLWSTAEAATGTAHVAQHCRCGQKSWSLAHTILGSLLQPAQASHTQAMAPSGLELQAPQPSPLPEGGLSGTAVTATTGAERSPTTTRGFTPAPATGSSVTMLKRQELTGASIAPLCSLILLLPAGHGSHLVVPLPCLALLI
jgi:hypothetical protein